MLKIIPNKKNIGAEINVNLKEITNKDIFKIKKALNKYGMLYFKEQKLTSKLFIKFAKYFGNLANYPRLKGLNKKFPQITVVQRKSTDKGPSFGEQFHTDSIYTKKPPRFTMLLSKLVPKKGKANTEFSSQYLAYRELPNSIKKKIKNLKGNYSSEGPISITTKERVKEKGKKIKELKSSHKIIKKISSNYSIYCSPGHFINFNSKIKNQEKLKIFLFNHQKKKSFNFHCHGKKTN